MVSPNFKTAGQPHRHHLYLSSQGFTPEHISAHLLKGSVKLKERSMGKSWETHGFFLPKNGGFEENHRWIFQPYLSTEPWSCNDGTT
jgi:hypothetical protein